MSFTATDDITVIARAEISVDAGPWKFVLPTDGIYDQRSEKFSAPVGKDLGAGVHSVIVRVVDAGGNVAVWQESFKGQ